MSWLKNLQTALVAQLNTMTLGVPIVSDWVPEIIREELSATELHVAPLSRSTDQASRNCNSRKADFFLLLVGPLEQGQEGNQAEAAQLLGDRLEELPNSIGGFTFLSVEQPMIFDHDEWRVKRKLSTTFILHFEKVG